MRNQFARPQSVRSLLQANAPVCNTQNFVADASRPPAAPLPPTVAATLLTRGQQTFLEFLFDPDCDSFCKLLFAGEGTCVGMMLEEFRKATKFHYFGHRQATPRRKYKPVNPGLLTADKSTEKKVLKDFTRLAYRGDPDRRGVEFWSRIAWILWNAYAGLMNLRHRAEKTKQQEIERMRRLSEKRAKRAAYMRDYRRRPTSKMRAKPPCQVDNAHAESG